MMTDSIPALSQVMKGKVDALQQELSKMPQCELRTNHYFHGGMYCREVFRHAGTLIIGAVHKKEHFYMIVHGTLMITDGNGDVQTVTGPHLFQSKPGTKRAVFALTDALCMTFHATDSKTVEDAEAELVELDPNSMYTIGNQIKHTEIEVQP